MSEFKAVCRGPNCQREIVMGELNGKPHPYDQVTCSKCNGRGWVKVVPQASMFDDEPETRTRAECPRCHGKKTVLRSHFESCVDAESFRRRA